MQPLKKERLLVIHPTLLIFLLIAMATGMITQIMIIWTIVIIHECGHLLVARLFRWRIDAVILWAFGGMLKTDEYNTRLMYEDLLVTIAGPAQHVIIFLLIYVAEQLTLFPQAMIEQAHMFNYIILLFNLLPIYPLDGGKLLLLFVSLFAPYRLAYRYSLLISFITSLFVIIAQFVLFSFTLSSIIIFCFLIVELYRSWQHEYFAFLRFLLHRYETTKMPQKIKILYVDKDKRLRDIFNDMWRHKQLQIHVNDDKQLSEKNCLKAYFKERKYNQTVGDIMNMFI